MENMQLIPTGGMGNDALAAGAGALLGSWFGNGFGGAGMSRGGSYGGYGDISNGVALGANVAATALISDIATLQGSITSNGFASAEGFATVNQNICNGFSNTTTSLNNTLTQQMLASQAQSSGIQSALNQGFSGVTQAVYNSNNDNRFALQGGLNDVRVQMAQCCCETQKSIAAEGNATRQLIQQNLITEMQVQLCDSKARVAQLENQVYLNASQAAQTQQIIQTVLAHLPLAAPTAR